MFALHIAVMERAVPQAESWAHARSAERPSTSYCHRDTGLHTDGTRRPLRLKCKARESSRRCGYILRAAAPEQAETSLESIATTEDSLAQPKKIRRVPGRQTYRPASFQELVKDATNSVKAAVGDGLTRMEVEFPALPGNIDGEG